MKPIIFFNLIAAVFSFTGCDDNYVDTGLANGNHDCSMYEYFLSDHSNWDSLVLLIQRADLVELVSGKDSDHPEITMLGITNLSMKSTLLSTLDDEGNQKYRRIADLPQALCRDLVLSHTFDKRMLRTQFAPEIKGTLEGGTLITTLSGREIRVYLKEGNEWGIDLGSNAIGVEFKTPANIIADVASGDIQTLNGAVHSMAYTYQPLIDYGTWN